MRELVVKYLHKKYLAPRLRRRPDQGGRHADRRAGRARLGQFREPGANWTGSSARSRSSRWRSSDSRPSERDRPGHIVPGHRRRGLCRAAYRLRREIRVRQLRQRRRRVLRGAGRPPAAQIHPDAARRTRRRHGRRLREGVGRADDRDAGRRGRHGERHRPDVQCLQGADAARRLLLPHRPDRSRRSRRLRGGAEPGADRSADHEVHLARAPRRHDPGDDPPRLQGIAWTPPMGPSYISWHSDYNHTRVRTDIISQDQFDPRMRVRPNPVEVERAAKLLVEAKMPILLVGDEIYRAKAVAKAVKLAELLGMPVVQPRQMYANFPEAHPLWCGNLPAGTMNSITWPKNYDVAINVGNKMQHNSPAPIVPRNRKFIDMRERPLEHGQCHAHRGAAGRRRRLRSRRPDRGGRATAHPGAQGAVRRARRGRAEVHQRGPRSCGRRWSTARTGTRRRSSPTG